MRENERIEEKKKKENQKQYSKEKKFLDVREWSCSHSPVHDSDNQSYFNGCSLAKFYFCSAQLAQVFGQFVVQSKTTVCTVKYFGSVEPHGSFLFFSLLFFFSVCLCVWIKSENNTVLSHRMRHVGATICRSNGTHEHTFHMRSSK